MFKMYLVLLCVFVSCLGLSCAPFDPNNAPYIGASASESSDQAGSRRGNSDDSQDVNNEPNGDNDRTGRDETVRTERGNEFGEPIPEEGPPPITRDLS